MKNYQNILITGGAGFIGGNLIRRLLSTTNSNIHNIDKLGYASDIESIQNLNESKGRHTIHNINLNNSSLVCNAVNIANPDLIIHLAAETHVDRSLDGPKEFMQSNITGTFNILQATLEHYRKLPLNRKKIFRFHHVSTDEVFGSLGNKGRFNETTKYDPRSPYSASKASSDHLVRAWYHSYGLPIIITNCSNNYGPYQFPEKLIPLSIIKALNGESIPVYGKGDNIRDWLYVEDHIDGIITAASNGIPGSTYCIGGNCEKTNLDLVNLICNQLDNLFPSYKPHSKLIKFVEDRPGHDFRYSIDSSLIQKELGWFPKTNINDGIKATINWYIKNIDWCKKILSYSGYEGQRLGLK